MKTRTMLTIGSLLVATQVIALVVYLQVESDRGASRLSSDPPSVSDKRLDSFEVTTRSGAPRELVAAGKPKLVHFWATWCAPCLEELPQVLNLRDDMPFEVVAVALDTAWPDVDAFLEGRGGDRVALANSAEAESVFELGSLPETLLLAPNGRVILRVNGARNWKDPEFVDHWSRAATDLGKSD